MAIIKPPNLADLRAKCTIQTRVTTQDNFGHEQSTWDDTYTDIWAAIDNLTTPTIILASDAILLTHRYLIKFRYRPGISTDMQIKEVATSRTYKIDDLLDIDYRQEWFAAKCTEIGNA